MNVLESLASGAAGACALTMIHETTRQYVADAPRMDVLGMRAIAKPMRALGQAPPTDGALHRAALAGDLVSNSLYYSLVGVGDPKGVWVRGAVLGLLAGLGGVFLPGPMGLGTAPSRRTPQTALMTVGYYLAGGLAAAAAYQCLRGADGASRS